MVSQANSFPNFNSWGLLLLFAIPRTGRAKAGQLPTRQTGRAGCRFSRRWRFRREVREVSGGAPRRFQSGGGGGRGGGGGGPAPGAGGWTPPLGGWGGGGGWGRRVSRAGAAV